MPLTPEEQQEFQQLHQQFGGQPPAPAQGALTPAEQQELAQLHTKFGGAQAADAPGSFQDETKKFIRGEDSPTWDKMSEDAGMMAAGNTANKAAAIAPALKSFFGRTATNAGIGGASGALRPVQDGESRLGNAAGGAAIGAGTSMAADAVGGTSNKLADWLQLGATGSKGAPGEGNRLVDMGLRGTRESMHDQVPEIFKGKEQSLQDLVKGTPGTEPSVDMANRVREQNLPRFQMQGGKVNANVQPEVDQINQFATNLQNTSPEFTNKDYLDLKRQGDWPGYTNAGTKAGTLEGQLGRSQADFARERLDKNTGGKSASILADEQALMGAGKALGNPYKEGLVPSLVAAKTGIPRSITKGVMGQIGAPIESYSAAGLQKGVAPTAKGLGQGIPLSMLLHELFSQKK